MMSRLSNRSLSDSALVVVLSTLTFLSTLAQATFAAESARPSIVLILADDLGRDWVGCYGAKHKTPNIDRLATQGVRYETAWSMPICTPTRVTLLTGQYPFRHGWVRHHDVPRWGGRGFRAEKHMTFARVLRDSGYATAIGGKWQINNLRLQPNALRAHGFDEHCVWTGAERGFRETEERYFGGYLQTNGKRSIAKYGPDAINEFLVDFVRRHKSTPFLVYYPMLLPHGPFGATPLNKEAPPEGKTARYADYVTYADRLVGRLVSEIDRLGIGKNTLIVFTGDNGSPAGGVLGGGDYPKGKGRGADCGAHVPFIVRAPFLVPQSGLRSNDLTDFTDLYPTFVDLARVKTPATQRLDGVSLLPGLRGNEDPFQKRNWIFSQIGEVRMIRDWQFLLDNRKGFFQVVKDSRQKTNLFSSEEKINPGRRERLRVLLERLPPNADPPFDGFGSR